MGSRLRVSSLPSPACPQQARHCCSSVYTVSGGLSPLPTQGPYCRGSQPRVPVSWPGRWAWGLGACSCLGPHAAPGQTLPMHPGDASWILTTGPLSAMTNTPDGWGQVQGVSAFTGAPPQKLPQQRGSRAAAPAPPVRGGTQETPLEWARAEFCAADVQTGSRWLWSLWTADTPPEPGAPSPSPSLQGLPEL